MIFCCGNAVQISALSREQWIVDGPLPVHETPFQIISDPGLGVPEFNVAPISGMI